MKVFKKFIVILIAVSAIVSSVAVFAFDGDEEMKSISISFSEIKKNIEKKNKGNIVLDVFLDKDFDGCYGNQLDEVSKYIYDIITQPEIIEMSKDGISSLGDAEVKGRDGKWIELTGKATFKEIEDSNFKQLFYAVAALDYDMPEVFWIDIEKIGVNMVGIGNRVWVAIQVFGDYDNYYCDGYSSKKDVERDIEKIDEVRKDVHKEIEGRDIYNKLRYINSFLVEKNEYNRLLGEADLELDDRLWKCVSALVYGSTDLKNALNPVCEGYSRAFKILCEKEGIQCVLASGIIPASEADGEGEPHMWNYVQLDNEKWYAVDVTFNDPIFSGSNITPEFIEKCKYKYFLIGEDKLLNINKDENMAVHLPSGDGIAFVDVFGLKYPSLEKDDYVYVEPDTIVTTENTTEITTMESTTETTTEEVTYKYGDIDKDGDVSVKDASELLESILKGTVTEHHKKYGNLDKSNTELTAADVSIVLQIALDNISY